MLPNNVSDEYSGLKSARGTEREVLAPQLNAQALSHLLSIYVLYYLTRVGSLKLLASKRANNLLATLISPLRQLNWVLS